VKLSKARLAGLVGAAAVPLLLVGWFFGAPLVSSWLILRPIAEPVATGSFGCPDVVGGAPTDGPSGQEVNTSIRAVQTGMLPGFARVIVYFPDAVPHYSVQELNAPVFATRTQTGDAFDVRLRGAYGLAIGLLWADTEGRDGCSVGPIGDVVVDGRLWDTGDQIALIGLGLSRAAPFRLVARRAGPGDINQMVDLCLGLVAGRRAAATSRSTRRCGAGYFPEPDR
jgi:hypothetical protein